jgi:hypothetical protein
MEELKNLIDISELPESARAELLDFYEFLKARHSANNRHKINKPPLESFMANPIKVDKIKKYSRDELHAR